MTDTSQLPPPMDPTEGVPFPVRTPQPGPLAPPLAQPQTPFDAAIQRVERATEAQERLGEQRVQATAPLYDRLRTTLEQPMPQPPPQQKIPPAPQFDEMTKKNLLGFAGSMAVFGALASVFARRSGMAALASFNGALKGWQEGNLEAYQTKAAEWQENMKRTIQNNQTEMARYKEILQNRKLNIDQQMSEIQLAGAQFQDAMMVQAAAAKNYTMVANLYMKKEENAIRLQNEFDKLRMSYEEKQQKLQSTPGYWLSPEGVAKRQTMSAQENAAIDRMIEMSKPNMIGLYGDPGAPTPGSPSAPPPPSATPTGQPGAAPGQNAQPGTIPVGTVPVDQEGRADPGFIKVQDWTVQYEQSPQQPGEAPLPPDAPGGLKGGAVRTAADIFLKSNTMQTVRNDPIGRAQATAIKNDAETLRVARGLSIEDVTRMRQMFKRQPTYLMGPDGRALTSLGTVVDHLDTARTAILALKNGEYQLFNTLKNQVAKSMGAPEPTNVLALGQIVGAEVVKAVVGASGGVAEREHAQRLIAALNNSPEQALGAIAEMQKLIAGQMRSKQRQAKVLGIGDADIHAIVGDRAWNVLSNLPAEGAGPATGTRENPTRVQTPEEARKLGPGTWYTGPPDDVLRQRGQ